ncbi:hypothetical protein M7I_0699 [Glarea lozoyensis 74030]|uniref:SRR1-like domain-containing protein n=1 Tax=Glarea lozoyensis (strain ATCC 74030 / MF5533) TaxID=1104152 RepID=H0EE31_GLAL7|nr:hypothetical protein M7I_0699 [Glarea lozoyensis 74030]
MSIDFLLEDAKARVGEPRPVPEFGLRITPLSRDKVKKMSNDEQETEKCRWLREKFPNGPDSEAAKDQQKRIVRQRDFAGMDGIFPKHLEEFRKTRVCERLLDLFMKPVAKDVKENSRSTKRELKDGAKRIRNIVAFGLGEFELPARKNADSDAQNTLIQHAAVVAIRDALEAQLGLQIPVFLQDPVYVQAEVELAKQHRMTIVRYGPGHQVGWNKINENSLVIHFGIPYPVFAFIDEFEQVGAILSSPQYKRKWTPFPDEDTLLWTKFLKFTDEKGERRLLYSAKHDDNVVADKVNAEYAKFPLCLDDLELTEMEGIEKKPSSSHLGGSTALYLRKSTNA